jgi:tetratricopeptide (TPR) repeat protein
MSMPGKRRRSRSLLPMALALLSVIAAGAAGAYLAIEGNPFASGNSDQTSRSSEAGDPPAPPDTPKETIPEKTDEPKTVEPKIDPKVEPKTVDPKVDTKTVDPKVDTKTEPKTVDPKMIPKIETKIDPKDEPKTNPKPEPKTEMVLDPGTGKYLVPQPTRLLEVQKQVREKYRDEYAKSKVPERMALADKLLTEAGRTKDDPVAMYVLFHEAGDQAFYAGDLDYCLRVVDEMDRRFLIPANEMRISLLEQASQSKLLPLMKKIAERALELAEQLVSENNYSDAGRLLTIARTAADRGKLPTLAAQAETRKRDVADIGREYDQAQRAFETLIKNAADADANLKWGKFVCWYKADWNAGLPFLTRGSDAKLRLLASTDLGKPTSPKVQVQLGDGWWDHAEATQGLARKNILLRSRSWYEKALPQMPVGEFERFRVEKRVKDIPNLISRDDMPTRPDAPPILPLKSYERQLAIGENSLNLRQYSKAIEGFSEALKFKPGDAAATKGLNDARFSLHMTNGYTAVNRKDYDRAVAEFQSALKYRPNDPQGSAALQQARFKKLTEKN